MSQIPEAISQKIKCEVCGAPGAKFRAYMKVTGIVVFSTWKQTKPYALCDDHKAEHAMSANLHNLLFGWWAPHAIFVNLWHIPKNFFGGTDVTERVIAQYANVAKGDREAIQKSIS